MEEKPEMTLILGWNHGAPFLLQEFDRYIAQNSKTTVMSKFIIEKMEQACRYLQLKYQNMQFVQADITNRTELETMHIPQSQHVILLSYSDCQDIQEAEAQTLITLLPLREIANQSNNHFSIASEILNNRNREFAEITRADNFIVTQKRVGLMLSQRSKNRYLAPLFQDVFDPAGVEIYLKPIDHSLQLGTAINFYLLIEADKRRNKVASGYRIAAQSNDPSAAYLGFTSTHLKNID
ncbi:MAG: hypothetical protein DDG59_10435 [Anaerolineae bacterium]|jgi:hypothetical protein|nr:MAG: hypothetical protein DDG59_10435 [Anaerolineae bacterium]